MTRINGEERIRQPSPSGIMEEARRRSMTDLLLARSESHNTRVTGQHHVCKYRCGRTFPTQAAARAHYASSHQEQVAPVNDAPFTAADGKTFTNPATRLAHEASINKSLHRCLVPGCPETLTSDMGLRAHIASHGRGAKTPIDVLDRLALADAANTLARPTATVNAGTVTSTPPSRIIRR